MGHYASPPLAMVADHPDAPVEARMSRVLDSLLDPARRLSCELPQGRKAARVNGLWRVCGVHSYFPGFLRLSVKGASCRFSRSAERNSSHSTTCRRAITPT